MRFLCQAIQTRAHIVEYLRRHIPGLEVVWDQHRSARLTWLSVLEAAGSDAVVVVEDDIILCKGFCKTVLQIISTHPMDLIQFHSRVKDDLAIGSRYRSGKSFCGNLAVYFPAGMSKALLEFSKDHPRWQTDPTGYDLLMGDYMQLHKLRYWNHVPSLCDHLPLVSEIDRKRSRFRQSATFQQPEIDGLPSGVLIREYSR